MSDPGQPEPLERSEYEVRNGRMDRRRERIYQQIQRDRAGGHKVPTWVLAAILVLMLAGWGYLIFVA
ncbi:hypothetical protein [Actinoplanes derwentensis]|uniref:Uncharacterized protein n=1 Tax=Actinoplanes derwentensis TaxID=113562 RepID=A0A1H1Q5W9_9ACTN|nr:hypothetical protein [Actinoplanes derwentensis]GID82227.1 hypothetical protein Ade03nite_11510 [Actinoplanes derwentensis]SDS18825.1 hypothetical protein SAMN04489716_0214 [Actinoplanes derwentensis]